MTHCDCPRRGDVSTVACRNERFRLQSKEHGCSCQCHASAEHEPRVPVECGIVPEGYVPGTPKPCPFCGGNRVSILHDPGEYDDKTILPRPVWAAICRSCAAEGPWRKSGAAAALWDWNRRNGGHTGERLLVVRGTLVEFHFDQDACDFISQWREAVSGGGAPPDTAAFKGRTIARPLLIEDEHDVADALLIMAADMQQRGAE